MPPSNDVMSAFTYAVYNTGYIFPLMAFFMLLSGISFIINKYTALTVVLVTPFILNAFLAHVFLDMNGIAPSAFIVFALLIVMFKNKTSYALIFKA